MALKRRAANDSKASIDIFIRDMKRFPVLNTTEEQALAHRCVAGDKAAMDKLVEHNLLFTVKMANQYATKAVPADDLISLGAQGLMRAAEKFKPNEGRFITYAVHWVRALITRFIAEKGRTVRFPVAASVTVTRLKKFKAMGGCIETSTSEEIREALGEETKQYLGDFAIGMGKRAMAPTKSLHDPVHDDESGEMQDNLTSSLDQPDDFIGPYSAGAALEIAIECLDPRTKHMIQRYHIDDDEVTLEELGEIHGISRERVRQLIRDGFKRMKAMHNNLLADALGEERYKVYWNKK